MFKKNSKKISGSKSNLVKAEATELNDYSGGLHGLENGGFMPDQAYDANKRSSFIDPSIVKLATQTFDNALKDQTLKRGQGKNGKISRSKSTPDIFTDLKNGQVCLLC